MRLPPSMQQRLSRALALWALVWSLGVAIAVGLAAHYEVDELLDEALVSASAMLRATLLTGSIGQQAAGQEPTAPVVVALPKPYAAEGAVFAWQMVNAQGQLLARSAGAPRQPWQSLAKPGMSDTRAWRMHGQSMSGDGRMLYVAITQVERREARNEVVLVAILAALAIGLLGHLAVRWAIRRELAPLHQLSQRVAQLDLDGTAIDLGTPERQEFQSMHKAIEGLTHRLHHRLEQERALAAHAAHALRTPLAGVEAQLAVAQVDAPEAMRARLQRARDATARLQRVVAALIGLFRTGGAPQLASHELSELLQRLPVAGLQVSVAASASVVADADLLSAALANVLDNAARQGARHVEIATRGPSVVTLCDDGPGIDAPKRSALQAALQSQSYSDAGAGLGLMLADQVARAHGGWLELLQTPTGFGVAMHLAPGGQTIVE